MLNKIRAVMNTHQGWRFHTIFTHHSAGEHSVELRMALTHRQVVAAVSKQLRQIKICYLYWFQNKADPIVAYVTWYKYCITASLLTPVYSGTYQQTQQDWAWDRGGKRERGEKKREMMMTVIMMTRMIMMMMASIVIILFLHINTVDE